MPHVGDVGEGRGRMIKALRKTVGSGGFEVAMVSQHTKTIRKDYGF